MTNVFRKNVRVQSGVDFHIEPPLAAAGHRLARHALLRLASIVVAIVARTANTTKGKVMANTSIGTGKKSECALQIFVLAISLAACGSSKQHSVNHPLPMGVPDNHRLNDAQCATPVAAGGYTCTSDCGQGSAASGCTGDQDCSSGMNGRCIASEFGGPAGQSPSYCTYDACTNDSNCSSGHLCACHGSSYIGRVGNTCVVANCRVDADCGASGYCSPSRGTTQCGQSSLTGYYCHTQQDACVNDADCAGICGYDPTKQSWQCLGYIIECA